MARISKSDTAPEGNLHVSLGAVEFDLDNGNSVYETNDPAVIADAQATPNLYVDVPVVDVEAQQPDRDLTDPHQNPTADHLSAYGSQEARDAAAANERAIKEATGADVTPPEPGPTVAESVEATLEAVQADGEAQVPDVEPEPTPPAEPEPTPPAEPEPTLGGDDS